MTKQPTMYHYKRTQYGSLTLALTANLLMLVNNIIPNGYPILTFVFATVALFGLAFGSFCIEIKNEKIHWYFGLTILGGSANLRDVAYCVPVSLTGERVWNVEETNHGTHYNIGGKSAVEIGLRSGERFLLGTENPRHLVEVIREATKEAQTVPVH